MMFFPKIYWNNKSIDIIKKNKIFKLAHNIFLFYEIFSKTYKKIIISIGNLRYEIDFKNVSMLKLFKNVFSIRYMQNKNKYLNSLL